MNINQLLIQKGNLCYQWYVYFMIMIYMRISNINNE